MDEREFRRLLDLFPVVRSRNYCADSEPSRGSTSHSPQDEVADWRNARNEMDEKDVSEGTYNEDTFWQKLRLAAERKVGPGNAEHFCKAFQRAHEKLVYEELSFDVAQRFMNAEGK
ncbi:uncharacterized protein [Elaeis guineensis]|uniref:Uncharacterized protein LOC105035190 isoform X2 n=1 Tax=Elaeis guineensis var. tenera TaxID=51953 RepID=A0A6I9QG35_ELAGV|nr:uncharacterized protein LOC105035190 isoform X2 [Elaeis guineensis]